jgi:outer membrane protein
VRPTRASLCCLCRFGTAESPAPARRRRATTSKSPSCACKQAKEGIALEVRQAYLTLQDAQKRLAVAQKGLAQATEALRLARVRFEAGVSPQLEISDAELAFTQAQTNLVNAQFDYLDAYAALLRAIGAIDEQYTRL